ncbi:ribonuclease P protein component [Synechococcus sp. M16CYN]|uniref:ribonuclease P protein component n=1 Tax=Synechococcus sp. M16CYN TaxID=3103139 RepID=UPI003248775D
MVLPASMRLRGYRCFSRLHRSNRRHYSQLMVLRQIESDPKQLKPELRHQSTTCRCALVISNRVSKRAVRRNRLRRLLHDHLRKRLEQRSDLADRWLLISLKPDAAEAEPAQLLKECDSLLKIAGLRK